jgi:hypothetical protein
MQQEMQLLASRSYQFLDADSLEERSAQDRLFRCSDGDFVLYMTAAEEEDRVVRLDTRAALAWINAPPEDFGLEWQ